MDSLAAWNALTSKAHSCQALADSASSEPRGTGLRMPVVFANQRLGAGRILFGGNSVEVAAERASRYERL